MVGHWRSRASQGDQLVAKTAAYDAVADWYEADFLKHQRSGEGEGPFAGAIGVDQSIVELLGEGTGRCLEVDCGTGVYSARLRDLGRDPIGIHLSAGMLRHAATRLPVALADATRLPLANASLPAVVAVMVHTDMSDYQTVLGEIRRVLEPGGVFVHVGVHPCFNGAFTDRRGSPDALIKSGYLDAHWVPPVDPTAREVGQAGQVRDKVGAAHVPLHTLLNWVVDAGFMVERSAEGGRPTPIKAPSRSSSW